MRVILKISGESLKDENNISNTMLEKIYNDIKYILSLGHQIVLVTGGGNFWRGRNRLDIDNNISDEIGMLATCMNALALTSYLNEKNIETGIYSAFEIENFIPKYNKQEIIENLNQNKVIVLGGGLGRPNISTDLTIATKAEELNCDIVIMAKNIDYVYDKDPKEKDAKKYEIISHKELIDNQLKIGKDKQGVMDFEAMETFYKNKTIVYLYNAKKENGIFEIFNEKNPGTIIKTI